MARNSCRRKRTAFAVTLIGLIFVHPVYAQSESEEPADDAEVLEDLDIDVQGSLDDVEKKRGVAVYGA